MPDTFPSSQRSLKPGAVVFGATADTLARINEAAVSLAVWDRSMPPEVVCWFDRTPPEILPTVRFVCRPVEARRRVMQAFAGHAEDSNPACLHFKEDLIGHIERFARICGASRVEVRLEAIASNACAKFHADNVTVRLLTTYRGPGTEWLDQAFERELCSIAHYPDEAVRQLPRFAVALIKGRQAKSRSGPLVLHRSPPIEGTGQTRFLACISDADTDNAFTVC